MENLMLSKRYESTKVDRRTWLHVPSGTPWSPSSDTHQVVEIKKSLLLRCIQTTLRGDFEVGITFYIEFKSLLYYHSFETYYICSYNCQRSCYEVQWN